VITVEESRSLATELEIHRGMALRPGLFFSFIFVNRRDRSVCDYENAPGAGSSPTARSVRSPIFLPVLEMVAKAGSSAPVILAEEVD